jgi:hypothetical protein
MDVVDWLKGLGLERYAALFRENHINGDMLAGLTADDLKEIGTASCRMPAPINRCLSRPLENVGR